MISNIFSFCLHVFEASKKTKNLKIFFRKIHHPTLNRVVIIKTNNWNSSTHVIKIVT